MNLSNIVTSSTGFWHLIFAVVALLSGTVVIMRRKGTRNHKRIGYVYVVSMITMLVTSFMIYRLYGKFGIFHCLAVVSTITLLGGMVPMLLKKPKGYVSMHFNFMYWSIIGLYAAFVAESLVRIPTIVVTDGKPDPIFYQLIGVGVFITIGLGYYFFFKKKKIWESYMK